MDFNPFSIENLLKEEPKPSRTQYKTSNSEEALSLAVKLAGQLLLSCNHSLLDWYTLAKTYIIVVCILHELYNILSLRNFKTVLHCQVFAICADLIVNQALRGSVVGRDLNWCVHKHLASDFVGCSFFGSRDIFKIYEPYNS